MKHLGEFINESDENINFNELRKLVRKHKINDFDSWDCDMIWSYQHDRFKELTPIREILGGTIRYVIGIEQSDLDAFTSCFKDALDAGIYEVEFTFCGEKFKEYCFPKPKNKGLMDAQFRYRGTSFHLRPVDIDAKQFIPFVSVLSPGINRVDDPRLVVKSVKKI